MKRAKRFIVFLLSFYAHFQNALPAQLATIETQDHHIHRDEKEIDWRLEGYKNIPTPSFIKHLPAMVNDTGQIENFDVEGMLATLSQEELNKTFPALAQRAGKPIKDIICALVTRYLPERIHWQRQEDNSLKWIPGFEMDLFWCAPCGEVDEPNRFLLILHQLNDILETYPEYQGNPKQPLVLTDFGEEGYLQSYLLAIGLLNINYYHFLFNMITGPQSTLFARSPHVQAKLAQLPEALPAQITLAEYSKYQCKKYIKQAMENKFIAQQKETIDGMSNLEAYEEIGGLLPSDHVCYWESVIACKTNAEGKPKAQLAHCISMIDPNPSNDSRRMKRAIQEMPNQFCDFAHHGAYNKRKVLVYSLNHKLRKYDCLHENFLNHVLAGIS